MAGTGRRRPSCLPLVLAAVAAVAAAACGETSPAVGSRSATTAAASPEPSLAGSTAPPTASSVGAQVGGIVCGPLDVSSPGRLARPEVTEASGLAASRNLRDVFWTHNDSGGTAGVYAFDRDGRDLGFFALVDGGRPADLVDPEDLAIADGTLYLADIGDNGRNRNSVAVYLFDEPTGVGRDGTVEVAEVIEVTYPDGSSDAEALLVDPITGQLVILSKDSQEKSGPTRIYTVDPAADSAVDVGAGEPIEATLAGSVDVAALTRSSTAGDFNPAALLFPGAVTGADVSPEGDVIALRTYGSVWLFRREPGRTLAEALQGRACEGGAAGEGQGEAVAILTSTGADPRALEYVTVGEGQSPPVNLHRVELDS